MSKPWIDSTKLDKFIEKIKELSDPHSDFDSSWFEIIECKYINIRIDMRNGDFILTDRDGDRISLDQLEDKIENRE